jgi:hypothetical protein
MARPTLINAINIPTPSFEEEARKALAMGSGGTDARLTALLAAHSAAIEAARREQINIDYGKFRNYGFAEPYEDTVAEAQEYALAQLPKEDTK